MLEINQLCSKIKKELRKIIVGQENVIDEILIGILCRGHILLEGTPGLGKTLLAKTLAHTIQAEFKRIQFTPDLMPSDVIGTNIFDFSNHSFKLLKGPVFTDILLADEINRTPPKTQSALLEAMEERQVSIDGINSPLSQAFFVIATQNPIEYEGTYPLPEAQLDRFLLKIVMKYPEEAEEKELLKKFNSGFDPHDLIKAGIENITTVKEIIDIQNLVQNVQVNEEIINYIYEIVKKARFSNKLLLGPSPRAAGMLLLASKAKAALKGKDFVSPDEVKYIVYPVFRHRFILKPEAEIEGFNQDNIISEILEQVKVPR